MFTNVNDCDMPADVIIDFSTATAVPSILNYAVSKKIPIVICTTGLSEETIKMIDDAASVIPVFRSANMSIGINIIANLLRKVVKILDDTNFDIEIIEKHHNQKIDAPSGTALLLADSMNETMNKKYEYVALLAKTNNGTIKNVFLINSNFETNCNTAGFVINNAGSISGAGFLDTDITATGFADSETESSRLGAGSVCDVAGIAINNTGTIFNASVYSSQIIAESLLVDVKAGGIAVNNSGNITNSFLRKCLVKAETTASTESQVSSIAGGIVAINSGLISDCYVENDGTSSRTVVATTGINGQADRYAIAGGIVGRMIGGEIKACYVYRVAINATRRVGGLVAEVPSAELGNVKITNCYVLRVGFSTAQERAMILADKLADGNVENVYCVLLDYTSIDTSNAIVVELSKLSELNIDGFIYDANYSERLSLKNMLYAKKYSVDYSKGANRDRDLVYAVENLNGTKALFECDLTSSGKKVDIYSYTINSGTDYAQEIILPIYVNVK